LSEIGDMEEMERHIIEKEKENEVFNDREGEIDEES
jgi:hypothetical protein